MAIGGRRLRLLCQNCGASYEVPRWNWQQGWGRYCSIKCAAAGRCRVNDWRELDSGAIEVQLTRGQVTVLDAEDWERLRHRKWSANWNGLGKQYFAMAHIPADDGAPRKVLMSRMLMGDPVGMEVDHINHDTLDNRRENLRVCSHRENSCSRPRPVGKSGYRGVTVRRRTGRFRASIGNWGKRIDLGTYSTTAEAAAAYNAAAQKYHGEFAVLNDV